MTLHKKLKKAGPVKDAAIKPLYVSGYKYGYEQAKKNYSKIRDQVSSDDLSLLSELPKLPSWKSIRHVLVPYLQEQTPETQVNLERFIRDYSYQQAARLPKDIRETRIEVGTDKKTSTTTFGRYFAEKQTEVISKQVALKGVKGPKAFIGLYIEDEMQTKYLGQKVVYTKYTEHDQRWTLDKGHKSKISYFYTQKSQVMRSSGDFVAVKLASREKGWLYGQRFIGEDEIRFNLRSLNEVTYAYNNELDLLALYDSMTPQQQADFTRGLIRYVNGQWERFYTEFIGSPPRQGAFDEATMVGERGIRAVLQLMRAAIDQNVDEVLSEIGTIQ